MSDEFKQRLDAAASRAQAKQAQSEANADNPITEMAACVSLFAWTYEGVEQRPLVSAIQRPFRVECNAIPDPSSRLPRSNNARRIACNP